MSVAVRNFFFSRFTNGFNLALKVENLTRKRVIAINGDKIICNFNHGNHHHLAIGRLSLEHHADFNPYERGFDHFSGFLGGAINFWNPGDRAREGERLFDATGRRRPARMSCGSASRQRRSQTTPCSIRLLAATSTDSAAGRNSTPVISLA